MAAVDSARRGSALLIVLGMLAFMVVSAVAFSTFMRQNRLPSSFLRQKIVSRHLVKAALAQAMNDIDAAVGAWPYPGVREGSSTAKSNNNYWRNRVLIGGNYSEGDLDDLFEENETVSTMPLEGLAYIPPPLVNTVRYWSRRSPTAQWHPLGYDAGRYAYTAVNVSDYLDINRVRADVMRDSSPTNRISLAYMFENDSHTGPGSVRPSDFDRFIDQTRRDRFRTRLVSLADYNLAVGSGKFGTTGFNSPFWDYIESASGNGVFYGGDTENVKRQRFVTDSWCPTIATNSNVIYLSDAAAQPFDGKDESLDDLQKGNGSEGFQRMIRHLDLASLAALYDYVDDDSVPISLAVPTIERVPMLTGIRFTPIGFAPQMTHSDNDYTEGTGENQKQMRRRTWKIASLGDDPKILFSASAAYPFKRTSGLSAKTSYDVQVYAALFFSSAGDDFSRTRLDVSAAGFRPAAPGDWRAVSAMAASDKAFAAVVGTGSATVRSSRTKEEDTLIDIGPITMEVGAGVVEGLDLYGVHYDKDDPQGTMAYDAADFSGKPLLYREVAGGTAKPVGADTALKLNFAVWVRILDGNDTVDLVPAMISDDQAYNGFNSNMPGALGDSLCGSDVPVIPLSGPTLLQLDLATAKANLEADSPFTVNGGAMGNLAIYCDDPRYNFAPEDWYMVEGDSADVNSSTWLSKAQDRCNGTDHRQRDIFQFVSDAGYLQSMGELQFLPFTREYRNGGSPIQGEYYNSSKYNGQPFASRTSPESLANRNFAWKTHWAFGNDADAEDGDDANPYRWDIADTRDGVVVNPYADSIDQLMAGLANTPYDWIVASEDNGYTYEDGAQYCFNARSQEARLDWDTLTDIARNMQSCFRRGVGWWTDNDPSASVDSTWDDYWYDESTFFGQSVTDFHDVDRKFLYSYWRNCFDNRQQLYLVFVRAEPTVMGGSSAGHTPSQLGARAVALVWREPVSSIAGASSSSGSAGSSGFSASYSGGTSSDRDPPHRMRILFYHQFD